MNAPEAEPTLRGPAAGQRVFGRYALKRILGRGGMGVVWAARDETLGEDVALKFLPDAVRWDPAAFDDLKAETRRARQLTHPNIVRIHDFVEDASAAAISMELVEGQTLSELRLQRENKILEPADLAPWLPQLCAALDYAHTQARVVHRDLKPANLMLTRDGTLKVADFGVARSLADSITRVSQMAAGTLVYMSPQQAMGEEPAPTDDLYALGATLYELLTGKPPFHTGDVRMQLFQRKPDSIAVRRRALGVAAAGEIPATWEKTIDDCLAKDPAARPANAGEVAKRVVAPVSERRWLGERAPKAAGRRPALLLAALAVVAAFAVWDFWPRSQNLSVGSPSAFPSDATRALAAWNFDGDARDASGHGLDGSAVNTVPTTDRFGRIDRALHFNGTGNVLAPDVPMLRWSGAQPFTAALWVRHEDGGAVNGSVWQSTGDAVDSLFWGLGFTDGHPSASFGRVQANNFGTEIFLRLETVIPSSEWHHFALVSDGTVLTLFVDGAKAVSSPLGPNVAVTAPTRVEMRFGRAQRLMEGALVGDLDDARLWLRALAASEIAALASRAVTPRIVLSQGHYRDTDDFDAALRMEFGETARLADWEDLKRLHADDARAWADEMGLAAGVSSGWLQRGGLRHFDAKRHYYLDRFDGVKPSYYLAHDEFGGMSCVLGSWYGNRRPLFVALTPAAPRLSTLSPDSAGLLKWTEPLGNYTEGLALSWRLTLSPDAEHGATATLRLRDGREFHAVVHSTNSATLAVALGPVTAGGRSWQTSATFGDSDFTFVVRDGLLRLRSVSVVGGNPLFQQDVPVPDLRLADVVALELAGVTKSRVASARLVIE